MVPVLELHQETRSVDPTQHAGLPATNVVRKPDHFVERSQRLDRQAVRALGGHHVCHLVGRIDVRSFERTTDQLPKPGRRSRCAKFYRT